MPAKLEDYEELAVRPDLFDDQNHIIGAEDCPFCGSDKVVVIMRVYDVDPTTYYIPACDNCSCYGPISETLEKAIETWNKRY